MITDKLQFNAVYAATFDPPTKGHAWMIREGLRLMKRLMIVVASNPGKTPLFAPEERMAFLHSIAHDVKNAIMISEKDAKWEDYEFGITAVTDRLIVDYAASDVSARYLIRGIRSIADFDYERQMQLINSDRNAKITTVFLMPPRELAEISSSLVKGLVPYITDWRFLLNYVRADVADALVLKHQISQALKLEGAKSGKLLDEKK
jgi:pantetheine-phosphate adenylyltransferase